MSGSDRRERQRQLYTLLTEALQAGTKCLRLYLLAFNAMYLSVFLLVVRLGCELGCVELFQQEHVWLSLSSYEARLSCAACV